KYLELALKNQQQVQSAALAGLLQKPARLLLKSNSLRENELALNAIGRLKIEVPRQVIIGFINDRTPVRTMELVLKALQNDPAANKDAFANIARDTKIDFDPRLSAVHSLSKADAGAAAE